MTHKYLLIEAGQLIDETTHCYIVMIGTSKQADRDYLAILANSMSCGYYFELYKQVQAEFLYRIQREYTNLPPLQSITARDYVRAMKQNLREPLNSQNLSQAHHMRNMLSLQYFTNSRLNRLSSSASVDTSKT